MNQNIKNRTLLLIGNRGETYQMDRQNAPCLILDALKDRDKLQYVKDVKYSFTAYKTVNVLTLNTYVNYTATLLPSIVNDIGISYEDITIVVASDASLGEWKTQKASVLKNNMAIVLLGELYDFDVLTIGIKTQSKINIKKAFSGFTATELLRIETVIQDIVTRYFH